MAAIDNTAISNILNATLPCGTTGQPAAFTNYATASGMFIRLDSSAPSASAAGTQLTNGTGYTTNGFHLAHSSTVSSAGSNVTIPTASDTVLWTCTSVGWSIVGLDITDSSQVRTWWGLFNGQPIVVAVNNSFQIATAAITVSLT